MPQGERKSEGIERPEGIERSEGIERPEGIKRLEGIESLEEIKWLEEIESLEKIKAKGYNDATEGILFANISADNILIVSIQTDGGRLC